MTYYLLFEMYENLMNHFIKETNDLWQVKILINLKEVQELFLVYVIEVDKWVSNFRQRLGG